MQCSETYCLRAAPNIKGNYGVSEIGIAERYYHNVDSDSQSSAVGAHELYGTIENLLVTTTGVMAAGLDGRIDQGSNYMYYVLASSLFYTGLAYGSSFAAIILDTTSTT